jgi:hypothetical protein
MGACVLLLASFLTTLGAPYQAASGAPLKVQAAGDAFRADVYFQAEPRSGEFSRIWFFLNDTANEEGMSNNTCGRENCVVVFFQKEGAVDNASEQRDATVQADGSWTIGEFLFVEPGNYTMTINVQTAYVFQDRIVLDLSVH